MRAKLREPEFAGRIRRLAGLGYHLLLPVYLLGVFLTVLAWHDAAPAGLVWARVLMWIGRAGLTALTAEKWIRDWKRAARMTAVLALALVIARISRPWYLYDFLLLICLSDLSEGEKTRRLILWAHLAMALLALLLRETGTVLERFEAGKFSANAYGFMNINSLAAFLLSVTLLARSIWLSRRPIGGWILCWGMAAVIFAMTRCVTAAALLAAFPPLRWALRAAGKREKGGRKAVPAAFAAAAVPALLSLGLAGYYLAKAEIRDPKGFLSSFLIRFSDGAAAIRKYGVTLFGQALDASYLTDNLYLYALLVFGAAGLLLLTAALAAGLVRFVRDRRGDRTAEALLFLAYGLLEGMPVLLPVYNFLPMGTLEEAETAEKAGARPAASARGKTLLSLGAAAAIALAAVLLPAPETFGAARKVGRYLNKENGPVLTEGIDLRQTFVSEEPAMLGAEILLAVGAERPAGTLVITLEDGAGRALEEKTLDASRLRDQRYATVLFDRAWPPGNYALRVNVRDWTAGEIAVRGNRKDRYPEGTVYLNGEATDKDWIFGLVTRTVSGTRAKALAGLAAGLAAVSLIWLLPGGKRKGGPRAARGSAAEKEGEES